MPGWTSGITSIRTLRSLTSGGMAWRTPKSRMCWLDRMKTALEPTDRGWLLAKRGLVATCG